MYVNYDITQSNCTAETHHLVDTMGLLRSRGQNSRVTGTNKSWEVIIINCAKRGMQLSRRENQADEVWVSLRATGILNTTVGREIEWISFSVTFKTAIDVLLCKALGPWRLKWTCTLSPVNFSYSAVHAWYNFLLQSYCKMNKKAKTVEPWVFNIRTLQCA